MSVSDPSPIHPLHSAVRDLEGLSILAAHPSDSVLGFLETHIHAFKSSLTKTQTGEHALYELKKCLKRGCGFDLVMVSQKIDDLSWTVLIRRIRHIFELSLPIILITESEKDQQLESEDLALINGDLRYPFSVETLRERIQHALKTPFQPQFMEFVRNRADGILLPARLPGINIERILTSLDLEFELIRKVLRGFRNNTPDIVSELERGFAQKDWQLVCERAHNIKGSAANIGAERLQQTCRNLEILSKKTLANSGDQPQRAFLTELQSAFQILMQSIDLLLSDQIFDLQGTGNGEADTPHENAE